MTWPGRLWSVASWRAIEGLLEIALLTVAIGCLGYVTWTHADAARFARQAELEISAQAAREPAPPPAGAPSRARLLATAGTALGRIEIASVGVAAFIAEGDDVATLRHAVGHVAGTAFPGESGNVGLAGHRDTFFRGLEKLAVGAPIRVTTPDGVFDYLVTTLEVVAPDRVDVLDPTPMPTLTLVTCYPFNYVGPAPQRFIVTAVQAASLTPSATAAAPLLEARPAPPPAPGPDQ